MPQPNDNAPSLGGQSSPTNAPMLGGKRRLTYKNIRPLLIARCANKCEQCGVENGAIGARDRHGEWHDESDINGMQSDYGYSLFGAFPDIITIVMVCTRLENEDIGESGLNHLRMYCQRCHFNERREPNMSKARETRQRKRLEANRQHAARIGQSEMDL